MLQLKHEPLRLFHASKVPFSFSLQDLKGHFAHPTAKPALSFGAKPSFIICSKAETGAGLVDWLLEGSS